MSPAAKSFLFLFGTLSSPATLAAGMEAGPSSIEVFTLSDISIDAAGHDATLYEIDGLDALERHLNEGLPIDPEAARRLALARINQITDDLQPIAEQAAEGLDRAYRYGLTKVPAVVFDAGHSVVYGVTDLDQAVSFYRQGSQP